MSRSGRGWSLAVDSRWIELVADDEDEEEEEEGVREEREKRRRPDKEAK